MAVPTSAKPASASKRQFWSNSASTRLSNGGNIIETAQFWRIRGFGMNLSKFYACKYSEHSEAGLEHRGDIATAEHFRSGPGFACRLPHFGVVVMKLGRHSGSGQRIHRIVKPIKALTRFYCFNASKSVRHTISKVRDFLIISVLLEITALISARCRS